MYELADARPAIERMYLYQWQGHPDFDFDSGLLGYDGSPRPAYEVVAARVGPRGGAAVAAPAAPAAPAPPGLRRPPVALAAPGSGFTLRPDRRLRLLAGGRLEVRARCIARMPARRALPPATRRAGRRACRRAAARSTSPPAALFTKVVRLGRAPGSGWRAPAGPAPSCSRARRGPAVHGAQRRGCLRARPRAADGGHARV